MPALSPSSKLAILGVAVAALFAALIIPPDGRVGGADRPIVGDHPVAALAWARTNCDARLEMKTGAHLEHAEVLMSIASSLDQELASASIEDVCREAIVAAGPAMSEARAAGAAMASKTAANNR